MDAADQLAELERMLAEAKQELRILEEKRSPRVEDQVKRAVVQQTIWSTKQLIQEGLAAQHRADGQSRLAAGAEKLAMQCSQTALKWSEQQTRAVKQAIADRVLDLENAQDGNHKKVAKLRVL